MTGISNGVYETVIKSNKLKHSFNRGDMDPIEKVASLISDQKISTEETSKPTPPPKRVKQGGEEIKKYDKEVREIHQAIQENLKIDNFKLNFSVEEETKTVVVRVIDVETGKVIREIPPAEIVALAAAIEKLREFYLMAICDPVNGNM